MVRQDRKKQPYKRGAIAPRLRLAGFMAASTSIGILLGELYGIASMKQVTDCPPALREMAAVFVQSAPAVDFR